NVREANQVIGDFYSLAACNDVGHQRLIAMMEEIGLDDLDRLGAFIFSHTRKAMLARIAEFPAGAWTNEMVVDGYDQPVKFVATVENRGETVNVDFTGTDEM